jgi:hypothetical protein
MSVTCHAALYLTHAEDLLGLVYLSYATQQNCGKDGAVRGLKLEVGVFGNACPLEQIYFSSLQRT